MFGYRHLITTDLHMHIFFVNENYDAQLEFEGMWEVVRAMEGEQPYMVPVSD